MPVTTAKKRGRKPGVKSNAKAYSVAGLMVALREGNVDTRRDAAKRYPLFATATADELLGSMTELSARKVEKWLSGTETETEEVEVKTVKNKPSTNGKPKRGPGRPPKAAEPEEDEEDEEDEEEETPAPKKRGRPPGKAAKAAKKGKVTASNKKASKRSVDEEDDDDVSDVLDDDDEEDEEDDDEDDDD